MGWRARTTASHPLGASLRDAGFFALRNSDWSRQLLRRAQDLVTDLEEHPLWDQAALYWEAFLVPAMAQSSGQPWRARVALVPQSWVNSYPLALANVWTLPSMLSPHAIFNRTEDAFVALSGCKKLLGPSVCELLLEGHYALAEERTAKA